MSATSQPPDPFDGVPGVATHVIVRAILEARPDYDPDRFRAVTADELAIFSEEIEREVQRRKARNA